MLLRGCYRATRVARFVSQPLSLRSYSINVAVVGSGPAGFYTTQRLLKHPDVKVDICGKLPVPFGLARSSHSGHVRRRTKIRSIVELMRLDKPTGTILALTPSLWSVGLITPETAMLPDLKTIAIFTAGAIAARGTGCTMNDILDRKYDRLVERTKMRPIACGDISTKEALVYFGIQSVISLYILCLNNLAVIKLGLVSGLMIASYPLFKRFTNWPQVMLALTMNWGVVMGYAAINGSIGLSDLAVLLPTYIGAIFWTMYYDTIYAHQDKSDDMFIGVKSSALVLGSKTKRFLNQMSLGMLVSLATAGSMTGQLWPYYLSLGSASLFQANQVRQLDVDNKEECWKMFDQQKYIGLIILGGVLTSTLLKHKVFKDKSHSENEIE